MAEETVSQDQSTNKLVWTDSWSVGIPILDKQNKELMVTINHLHQVYADKYEKEDILTIIHQLYSYCTTHTSAEENILRGRKSEFLEFQEIHHAIFLDYIIEVEQKVSQGNLEVVSELLDFLNTWWNEHILKIDRDSLL